MIGDPRSAILPVLRAEIVTCTLNRILLAKIPSDPLQAIT